MAAIALLLLALFCWRRRRRNRSRKALEHRTKSFAMDAANGSMHGADGGNGDTGNFKHYNSTYEVGSRARLTCMAAIWTVRAGLQCSSS